MKYCIVTPTFRGHFQFIPTYLESYCRFVKDAEEIPVIFTVNRAELDEFKELIMPYIARANIQVLAFEDILKAFSVPERPEDLLEKYGRFSFQTLKKYYTMLYVDAEKFLILDSESAWIRKCSMIEEFESYFGEPFVAGSLLANRERKKKIIIYMAQYADELLGVSCDRWTIETFMWYVDRTVLNDMLQTIGSPYECAKKIHETEVKLQRKPWGFMEALLYQDWLYLNHEKYGYRMIDVDKALQQYLPGDECQKYRDRMMERYGGSCGYLERPLECIDWNMVNGMARLYLDNNIRIARCQKTDNFEQYKIQKAFLRRVKPCILACAQNCTIMDQKEGYRFAFKNYKNWMQEKLPEGLQSAVAGTMEKVRSWFRW